MSMMDPLADRRQRALEAFADSPGPSIPAALGDAIEVATRVKVTNDITLAAVRQTHAPSMTEARGILVAGFRAAGFEVIE